MLLPAKGRRLPPFWLQLQLPGTQAACSGREHHSRWLVERVRRRRSPLLTPPRALPTTLLQVQLLPLPVPLQALLPLKLSLRALPSAAVWPWSPPPPALQRPPLHHWPPAAVAAASRGSHLPSPRSHLTTRQASMPVKSLSDHIRSIRFDSTRLKWQRKRSGRPMDRWLSHLSLLLLLSVLVAVAVRPPSLHP